MEAERRLCSITARSMTVEPSGRTAFWGGWKGGRWRVGDVRIENVEKE